jgi:hypothetical protein
VTIGISTPADFDGVLIPVVTRRTRAVGAAAEIREIREIRVPCLGGEDPCAR